MSESGSGVSGGIHKAAGPELEQYAKRFAPLSDGEAILTPAFNANASHIVHTVCPRFYDGQRGEQQGLRDAYASALKVCEGLDKDGTIAFVSMGTGVYKWPVSLVAETAMNELSKSEFKRKLMCILDNTLLEKYLSF